MPMSSISGVSARSVMRWRSWRGAEEIYMIALTAIIGATSTKNSLFTYSYPVRDYSGSAIVNTSHQVIRKVTCILQASIQTVCSNESLCPQSF